MKSFGSDNHSGIHPDILKAIAEANVEHDLAYGDDRYTARLRERVKELFGASADCFPVFNGTGANILSLKAFARSYNSVICAETAHIQVDECASPETAIGCKLLTVTTPDGKLTPDLVAPRLVGFGFQHHAQPRVISITQPTELGTLYTVEEIRALADQAHAHGMILHMDGARIANAVAALDVAPRTMTVDAGVDVLSFGGTKNGLMAGEMVVVMDAAKTPDILYQRKNAMQLASKMRFISAQFCAYLTDDLWLRLARHANAMAQLLCREVSSIAGVRITQSVDTNAVFVILPSEVAQRLLHEYFFYDWDENRSEYRWMCSFDTTEEDIHRFVEALHRAVESE